MWELFSKQLGQYAGFIVESVVTGISVFVAGLAFVYALGRLLEIVLTDRGKNLTAIFTMALFATYLVFLYDIDEFQFRESTVRWYMEFGWRVAISTFVGIVIYTIFGMRLFSRMDAFLDRRFGKDKFIPDEGKKIAEERRKRRAT